MTRKLFINRKGTLVNTVARDANQCKAVGHPVFYYTVRVECAPQLDKNGFLIDHNDIDSAMVAVVAGDKIGSCEEIVLLAAELVTGVLNAHAVEWVSCHITLKPEADPLAFMEILVENE